RVPPVPRDPRRPAPTAGAHRRGGGRLRGGDRADRERSPAQVTAAQASGEYHLFHAIRADLLRRLGRIDEAAVAYEAAIALTGNAVERKLLQRRRQASTTCSTRSAPTCSDGWGASTRRRSPTRRRSR